MAIFLKEIYKSAFIFTSGIMHKSYSSVIFDAVYDAKMSDDLFVFAFGLARGVAKKHQISELRACLRDQISCFIKIKKRLRF